MTDKPSSTDANEGAQPYQPGPPQPTSGSRVALPALDTKDFSRAQASSLLLGAGRRTRMWWTSIAVLGVLLLSTTLGLFIWYWFMGYVTTVAGTGSAGYRDGAAWQAKMFQPHGLAIDKEGNIFISDSANHCIRKIDNRRIVSTLAGNGESGMTNGPALAARFHRPGGIALGTDGALYIADTANHMIRKLDKHGVVSTVAGSGKAGHIDGPAASAEFHTPMSLTISNDGTIYVADTMNHRIRKISPKGIVTTHAGSARGFQDSNHLQSMFDHPTDVALHPNGKLYVADSRNNRIRVIDKKRFVHSLVGNGSISSRDGQGYAAGFHRPTALVVGKDGLLYVSDSYNHRIRRVTTAGVVSTIAGNGDAGGRNGPPSWASFTWPQDLAFGPRGNLYVAGWGTDSIRKVSLKLFR